MTLSALQQAQTYLASLPVQARSPQERLEYVRTALQALGNPQNSAPAIHIAGTSGKGSTAYYAAALLQEAGYVTGLTVSPHVRSVKERSQVNGAPLSDEEYLSYFNQFIESTQDFQFTYIEFLTVFSFWLFAQRRVDYLVVEVGMGGRLDPTNVLTLPNTVRVITDIGLDHTEILGETLVEIAAEKAGIIHAGNSVVMHSQPDEVVRVVQRKVTHVGAELTVLPAKSVSTSSLPPYQQRNWLLAVAAVNRRLELDGKPLLKSTQLTRSQEIQIPGRFEKRHYDEVEVIFDSAHNPQKIIALIQALQHYRKKAPIVVVAMGANKRSTAMESLALLADKAESVIATQFIMEFHGAHGVIPALELAELIPVPCEVVEDSKDALRAAIRLARQNDTYVVVTGSFYLLSELYESGVRE